MTAPTDKAERAALATLSDILTYVAQKFFMPTGLAKGLGRKLKEIEADVKWLMEHGYVAQMQGEKKLYVTHKGWMTDSPSSASENEIVFTPTPTPEGKDADDEE